MQTIHSMINTSINSLNSLISVAPISPRGTHWIKLENNPSRKQNMHLKREQRRKWNTLGS